jgi:glutamate synthase domain-containing protein 3
VINDDVNFPEKCNTEMVELCKPDEEDAKLLQDMLSGHLKYTGSKRAKEILEDFPQWLKKCVKVFPKEYKAVLELRKKTAAMNTTEA